MPIAIGAAATETPPTATASPVPRYFTDVRLPVTEPHEMPIAWRSASASSWFAGAEHAPASHPSNRRKASAQSAAQDLPDIRGDLTLTRPATPVRADPADAGQRKRLLRP